MKDNQYTESELAEIAKTIESMPGICADGKKGVTALVEKLVGKKLTNEIRLEGGQLYRAGASWCDMLIIRDAGNLRAVFLDKSDGVGARACEWSEEEIRGEIKRRYKLVGRVTDIVKGA
jgi:hypothetical protein